MSPAPDPVVLRMYAIHAEVREIFGDDFERIMEPWVKRIKRLQDEHETTAFGTLKYLAENEPEVWLATAAAVEMVCGGEK